MTAGITQATGPPLILMQSSIHQIKWILMSNYLYKFSIFLVDMLSYLHWWAFHFCPFQNKIVDFDTCNCMSKNKNSTKLWVSLKCSEVFKLFPFILYILEELLFLNLRRINEERGIRNMKTERFLLYLSGSNYLLWKRNEI